MKHGPAYWRFVYRTSGGWRGVRWCLNCLYGPIAWKRIVADWWRGIQTRRSIRHITPDERAKLLAVLKELSK